MPYQPNDPMLDRIEELSRKFFVGPGDDERFKKWGEIAVELALDWQKNPEKRKIHADITLPELAQLFSETVPPKSGKRIEDVFQECKEKILDNSVRINNPRYIGHMTTVLPWFSVVIDILTNAINQNQVKIETALASSYVERQTISWLHRMVYQREESFYQRVIHDNMVALGNTTSGGTLGNLTALAVARETMIPGVRQEGFIKAFAKTGKSSIAIFASSRVHYSVAKAAAILGLGEESVIMVPVDSNNRIQLSTLEALIEEEKAKNALILAVVGIAGTTETGNVDPIREMAAICKKERIWFHVDAAWGGALLLSDELRHQLGGIEEADSVVLDGHKLFYLAMSHSAVVFKDPKSMETWRHNANYIIRKGSVDLGRTSFEGSRRFNALKLWFTLKMLGTDGYHVLLKKAMGLTEHLDRLIGQDEDFECTSTPGICILTYRFVPKSLKAELEDPATSERANHQLNEINVEIQKRQRENGVSFTSRTILESTKHPIAIVVLRAVLTNLLTKTEYLSEILDEQRELGYQILAESQD